MSKIKMRCNSCGKWFQSANAKEVICPDCAQKARREKLAAKNAPAAEVKGATAPPRQVAPPPPKQKPTQSGTSHWLDSLNDVKVGQPDQPPQRKIPAPPPQPTRDTSQPPVQAFREPNNGSAPYRDQRGPGSYRGPGAYREEGYRGPGGYREDNRRPYRVGGGNGLAAPAGPRPRQPMDSTAVRGPRPDRAPRPGGPARPGAGGPSKPRGKVRPQTPPKPKREKTPPPTPFTPTPEQVEQVEKRYLELATPSEFDGIRTQIAKELGFPKKAVKNIIKQLRDTQDIPSWWEIQTYKGSADELDRIKNVYVPRLPVPPVGVHKELAEQLALKPGVVYQAIKAIRLDMNLPQYNDPAYHEEELAAIRAARAEREAAKAAEKEKSALQAANTEGSVARTEDEAPPTQPGEPAHAATSSEPPTATPPELSSEELAATHTPTTSSEETSTSQDTN